MIIFADMGLNLLNQPIGTSIQQIGWSIILFLLTG